jgi:hypothetical protein
MKIVAITPRGKYDSLANLIIEGMQESDVEIVASDTGNGISRSSSDWDIVEFSKIADFIFVFWGKPVGGNTPKYYLLDHIKRPESTVFIDGSEWNITGHVDGPRVNAPWGNVPQMVYDSKFDTSKCKGHPWLDEKMFNYCKWYFKRECYIEDLEKGIIPLNLGADRKFFTDFGDVEKDIDIFVSFGHLYTGLRYETVQVCNKLKEDFGYNVVTVSNVAYNEYQKMLARSKIVVSAWGAGNSCRRMFEGMASGSCTFIQRPEIEFLDMPSDMKEAVLYSSIDEFTTKVHKILESPNLAKTISAAGRELAFQKHTGKARFDYMINAITRRK